MLSFTQNAGLHFQVFFTKPDDHDEGLNLFDGKDGRRAKEWLLEASHGDLPVY